MKHVLLTVASLALFAFGETVAYAGDHGSHPPMAPPLSVTCAGDFNCLHPGYVAVLNRHHDLSTNFEGGYCAGYGRDDNGCIVCTSPVVSREIFF